MTRNEVSIIKNAVLDATEAYVDARLNSSDFVKTQIGVTSGNPTEGTDGKYRHTVVCNKTAYTAGVTYTNVLSVGNVKFPSNSVVFLIAPNAQYSNQFILGKLDNTPANIVGGTIKIGRIGNTDDYYFNVNDTGNVTIKGVDSSIQLAQDGSTNYYHVNLDKNGIKLGHISSSNYYFTVDATTGKVVIKGVDSSIQLAQDGSTNYYHVNLDKNGIKLGHVSGNNYNFTVDATTGSVTIKKGSINIANKFYTDVNGNLFIGGTDATSANFHVTSSDGSVTIKKGSINIGNGQFEVDLSGNVTAKYLIANNGGQIGGAQIYSDRLEYSSGNALFSKNLIACGEAGNGTASLCGNRVRGTSNKGGIIICNQYNSGSGNPIRDGLWIDGGGTIRGYDSNGIEIWWFNLADGSHS